MRLVSLAALKEFLEFPETDTNNDALLSSINVDVSKEMETYLDRTLSYTTNKIEYFNGGKKHYYVNCYPIDTTKTITVVYDESAQVVNEDYYLWEDDGEIEFMYQTLKTEPKNIVITYTGGYALTTVGSETDILNVPVDLKKAAKNQIIYEFSRRRSLGATNVSMPDGSVGYQGGIDWLPSVQKTLDKYRKTPSER